MGKIVSNFFISLDGVVESPDKWHFPYFNDEMGAAVSEGIENSQGLLMGRVLYDEWSAYWPTSKDEPFASFINSVPKYVVSTTLNKATWNNTTVVSGDVAGQLRKLKEQPGNITMSGSATLVRWLLANGVLDELNLLIHPIVVGRGQHLFEDTGTYPLRLTHQKTFQTGVLHVKYEPADE
jgi:dihydrofolate reductase